MWYTQSKWSWVQMVRDPTAQQDWKQILKNENMFVKECKKVRKALYGVRALTQDRDNLTWTNGTGFMIFPSIIVTAGHLIHIENDFSKPIHKVFHVINALDIGKQLSEAKLLAEDPKRDVSILQVQKPTHTECVILNKEEVEVGTECGSLGFPLSEVKIDQEKKSLNFTLVERFQGANISAISRNIESDKEYSFYETDSLMYRASSGCPGFTSGGKIFGMHTRSIMDKGGSQNNTESRVSISLWVPSKNIIEFIQNNGINLLNKV